VHLGAQICQPSANLGAERSDLRLQLRFVVATRASTCFRIAASRASTCCRVATSPHPTGGRCSILGVGLFGTEDLLETAVQL
jgi:hypothetical protein